MRWYEGKGKGKGKGKELEKNESLTCYTHRKIQFNAKFSRVLCSKIVYEVSSHKHHFIIWFDPLHGERNGLS